MTQSPCFLKLLLLLTLLAIKVLAGTTTPSTKREYEAVRFKGKKTKNGDDNTVHLKDEKTWIEWNINLAEGSEAILAFRHSNTMSTAMDIVLKERNAVITVDFAVTAWGEWGTTTTTSIPLQAGMNTIILTPSGGTVAIDVHKLMSVENSDAQDDSGGGGPDDSGGGDPTVTVIRSTGIITDHTQQIQTALDRLLPNDTLQLVGDFIISRTIYLPSDFTWRLDGSLTLGKNAVLDVIDWRPGAITETSGGASNIYMSGGLYHGNRNENIEGIRFLNFVQVEQSTFRDMTIVHASDDNFSLGHSAQYNEVHNLVSRYAGGNGLSDKGSYNKWYDCVAEYCDSDGWTPKSRYSEFHRCVARENKGPGKFELSRK